MNNLQMPFKVNLKKFHLIMHREYYILMNILCKIRLTCQISNITQSIHCGTNVTWALQCSKDEQRMIVSIDMPRIDHFRQVDRKNMAALVETGITGKDLEKELSSYGIICGHEPCSVYFSILGGWISTRASDMKKN
ncbi:unnamed protein product [Paramecium sonneborni]|uniref:Alkylglycerone-phosphate synthase n=1 Tax=Paramecium sonneborni TaxID=65129 RepID=A0A8S1RNW3_9CILI|nr:unnamed protein product [Paramecium sonneborni]